MRAFAIVCVFALVASSTLHAAPEPQTPQFDFRSIRSGAWSDPKTWEPAHVPTQGNRVLISRNTRVTFDVANNDVIRLLQVAGTLTFARDRDTVLNVGILKVQNSERCSENGFRCDLHAMTDDGEPNAAPGGIPAALEVGTLEQPIPAGITARIRLHFLEGMNRDDAPAISACSARMDFHGAPMNRTWVKLGADLKPGDAAVVLSEPVTGWHAGDSVIVTGSIHGEHLRTYRPGEKNSAQPETEERLIASIDGARVILDRPLEYRHFGSGEMRSEIANLSRNVIVESADKEGVRGHTIFHQFSSGGISYARFAYLGKEGALGRYPIHFHLVEDTMRGSGVIGAAIVDSHNRWITLHGAQYLLVRDCVGYRSVGHGFFMEDGTEVYNLLDRNLGVQAFRGKRLPKQALGFDPNDGAAFWWANGRNSLTRNVSCENDEYGFRYDSQSTSRDSGLMSVRAPDGNDLKVDIRTLPFYRFDGNEAHTEGLYGMVFAGNNQRGDPIKEADQFARIDRTGPDTRHPHIVRNARIWQVHYGLRPQIPAMLLDGIRIDHATYGIYRPALENHVYRNITIAHTTSEPFNRGMDDASTQFGTLTVDHLTFEAFPDDRHIPLIQMSDNNPAGTAESHFRNVVLIDRNDKGRRALVDRGGGTRTPPLSEHGVPVFLHDYFGKGRTAKITSTTAHDFNPSDNGWRAESPLTGSEARVSEVGDIPFPKLLDPLDDLPPATMITEIRTANGRTVVRGVAHDNGPIARIIVNGRAAQMTVHGVGVVDWEISLDEASPKVTAAAVDQAGNRELTPHEIGIEKPAAQVAAK
jgi:hypothetical protein